MMEGLSLEEEDGEKTKVAFVIHQETEVRISVPGDEPTDSVSLKNEFEFDYSLQPEIVLGGLDPQTKVLDELLKLRFETPENMPTGMSVQGILLTGPTGTGKTSFMQRYTQKDGVKVLCLNLGLLGTKYQSEAEDQIRSIFEAGLNSQPAIIFLDEID
jgi:ATP-dependent 26S proteasome regulatory subunit